MLQLIPFIIGILAGYLAATVFYLIGNASGMDSLLVIDYSAFQNCGIFAVPDFTFLKAAAGWKEIDGTYILTLVTGVGPGRVRCLCRAPG